MNKKGFTLIELLAVIVILAIIAIIAVPKILGVIETAKKGAAESSALGYIDAVEKQIAVNIVNHQAEIITDGEITVGDLKTRHNVKVKGKEPKDDGIITLENGKVIAAVLKIAGYEITCTNNTCKAGSKTEEPEEPEEPEETTQVNAEDIGITVGGEEKPLNTVIDDLYDSIMGN